MNWQPVADAALALIAACIVAATPAVVAWVRAKTHSQALATAAQVGGDVAYRALVAANQGGKIDYRAAERAALAEGLAAVRQLAGPAIDALPTASVVAAVGSGLGAALKADPTVSPIGAAVATAVAAKGETATATAG